MPFIDHFGGHADAYQRFRPAYPDGLFELLAAHAQGHDVAWDVGTGSGQAASALASRFTTVVGTDASIDQLRSGSRRRVVAAVAEQPPFAPGSVDLVTVAQALHWFDLEPFYRGVRGVLRPQGLVAAWTYALPSVTPAIDQLIVRFHDEIVGPFWPKRRRHVIRGYRDLAFPFSRLASPDLVVEAAWDIESLYGYLGTWSAAQRFRRANNADPLAAIRDPLAIAWGELRPLRTIRWPLTVLLGVV